jgi:hypothetical protein
MRVVRYGTNDRHANLAVSLFDQLVSENSWSVDDAWLAVAKLLITCRVFEVGAWRDLYGSPVLMERNNYKISALGRRNQSLKESDLVRDYLATKLVVPREAVCSQLGQFFDQPAIQPLQPNNPRGHAFRSTVARFVERFGDPELDLFEEVSPHDRFPGFSFEGRSKKSRIDILATRKERPVAILSIRWTYRHDRVDMIDEAREYLPAARRTNSNVAFFGVTAEFVPARLKKVIAVTEPVARRGAALTRLVHLNPYLCRELLGRNGELAHLWSLADLAHSSFSWK